MKRSQDKRPQIYLGDGAYAEWDGYAIKVYTERDNGMHFVYLEQSAIEQLVRFFEECTAPGQNDT